MIKGNEKSPRSKSAVFISAAVVIAALVMAWPSETDNGSYAGYLVELSDDSVVVDIVEYVKADDTEKMKELNLTEEDLPDGYYIYNPDEETTTWKLRQNTSYTFTDWDPDSEMPLFFEVSEGIVQSIAEEPSM